MVSGERCAMAASLDSQPPFITSAMASSFISACVFTASLFEANITAASFKGALASSTSLEFAFAQVAFIARDASAFAQDAIAFASFHSQEPSFMVIAIKLAIQLIAFTIDMLGPATKLVLLLIRARVAW